MLDCSGYGRVLPPQLLLLNLERTRARAPRIDIADAGIFVHSTLLATDVLRVAPKGKIWICVRGRRDRIWIIPFSSGRDERLGVVATPGILRAVSRRNRRGHAPSS